MLDIDLIRSMQRSRVGNYVIPGLSSSLIGGEGHGLVRMFTQSRSHEEPITPHSHRFDFQCLVLSGHVLNRVWIPDEKGDEYQCTTLEHQGSFGDQTRKAGWKIGRWSYVQTQYKEGQLYSMKAEQIHSIYFSKGAEVLFFEGPSKGMFSSTLEPVVDGEVIPTFKVEPWMFRKQK